MFNSILTIKNNTSYQFFALKKRIYVKDEHKNEMKNTWIYKLTKNSRRIINNDDKKKMKSIIISSDKTNTFIVIQTSN